MEVSFFFFSSRRRHTRSDRDWSSDVCSSDLRRPRPLVEARPGVRATDVARQSGHAPGPVAGSRGTKPWMGEGLGQVNRRELRPQCRSIVRYGVRPACVAYFDTADPAVRTLQPTVRDCLDPAPATGLWTNYRNQAGDRAQRSTRPQ